MPRNRKDAEVGPIADAIGRSDYARIQALWHKRFGTRLERIRDLLNWLCDVHGLEMTDAENLTFASVVNFLRPNRSELNQLEREILDSMEIGEVISGQAIVDALAPTHFVTVREYLGPKGRLRTWGFVEKCPGRQGYIRRI